MAKKSSAPSTERRNKIFRGLNVLVRLVLIALVIAAPLLLFSLLEVSPKARIGAFACTLLGMVGLLVMSGLVVQGRTLGVLVDERNRYSLARLQITLWTSVIVATLYTVMLSNLMRAGDWAKALNIDMDLNLVLVMGFSLATFTTAPLALSRKSAEAANADDAAKKVQRLKETQELQDVPVVEGKLVVKQSPRDARLADFVRSEEVNTVNTVDLARTQMLIISIVVVLAYAGTVVACMIAAGSGTIHKLPELSNTLLMFIVISHGGYLMGKLVSSTGSGDPAAGLPSTAMHLSQRASALSADLQAFAATVPAGDARRTWAQGASSMAGAAAAEAAALTAQPPQATLNDARASVLEGKLHVLQANLRTLREDGAPKDAVDAPMPETVRQVQRKLGALGYVVPATGVPDASTEQAIRTQLAQSGLERKDLHPRPFRYYEEVAQLI